MTVLGQSPAAIGMMEGAFFVSKKALLKWLNALLNASIARVEDCANGAAYCRVLAALYPQSVNLKKVNNQAKLEYEILGNYKILQKAFDECQIKKHIEVDKLIRGKFQDNLEFLQWLKCFYEKSQNGNPSAPRLTDSQPMTVPVAAAAAAAPKQAAQMQPVPQAQGPKHEEWEVRRERDFFLNKLQHIEILTNGVLTRPRQKTPAADAEEALAKQVQAILFNPEFI